jgi:hypothetical protein
MNQTNWQNTQQKGPVSKSKVGRFDVSVWRWVKAVPQPPHAQDLLPERPAQRERARVRYSIWNAAAHTWYEQTIWCSVDQLRDLVQALDGLNFDES